MAKETFNKDEDFEEGLKKNSLSIKVFKGYLGKKTDKALVKITLFRIKQ